MVKIEKFEHNKEKMRDRKSGRLISRNRLLKFLRSNLLVLLMMLGVFLGVVVGVGLNQMNPKLNNKQIVFLRFPGDLFIQLIQMQIIPIVVSSLVTSTAEMDLRSSGKIGLRALVYYLSTLVLASALGMTLAVTVRPGENISKTGAGSPSYELSSSPVNAFMDLLRNMVPDNLIEVCFLSKKTKVHRETGAVGNGFQPMNISNASLTEAFSNISKKTDIDQDVSLTVKKVTGANMIGLVVASIVFGCAISVVGAEARPLLKLCSAIKAVSFRLISVFIWTSPVGIAFLVAAKLAQLDDPSKTFEDLVVFTATVSSGLLLHILVTLPLIYFIVVRKNPFKFIRGIIPAIVFAFGSSSSAATLPLTMQCLQEKNRVDPRVTKIVTSVGATINMDGTCLYHTIMPVFIAQMNNIQLIAGDYLTICLLAVSIAVGAAAVPEVGVVYILMMLSAMDLPTHDVSTLLAIDWFLVRCRTAVNVAGDGFGAGIIEHLSKWELHQINVSQNDSLPTNGEEESSELMVAKQMEIR